MFAFLFRKINRFLCLKLDWFEDPITKQIIEDRQNNHLSYTALSEKYKKSITEIKQIWYDSLGLSYITKEYRFRDLPPWLEGLDTRPAQALLKAGFTSKKQIKNFISKDPKKLLNIDAFGNKSLIKVLKWLGK